MKNSVMRPAREKHVTETWHGKGCITSGSDRETNRVAPLLVFLWGWKCYDFNLPRSEPAFGCFAPFWRVLSGFIGVFCCHRLLFREFLSSLALIVQNWRQDWFCNCSAAFSIHYSRALGLRMWRRSACCIILLWTVIYFCRWLLLRSLGIIPFLS